MASYLQVENLSKSYGPKILFEHIGFNINEGDKIALIAPNGTGKTSLLRILAGHDKSDSNGKITFLKQIRIAFLEQEYSFDPESRIFDQVLADSQPFMKDLDENGRFEYEMRITRLLTDFSLSGEQKMSELSGGEVKRVALTQMLATEADFHIMDEPTNHLDTDAIEYLEDKLSHSRCTLFMVTHDRYFLDRVCNTIMEMDHGAIYTYRGDYENYLEKRQERIDNYNAETDKVRNVLRRELEWIHASPCARTGKAKYRKNAFQEIKARAEQVYRTKQISIDPSVGVASRLGSKIIDCKDVSFYYEGKCYLSHFTYNFQRGERVGIVGRNGVGKSTFINLLTGSDTYGGTLTGVIERGESLKIGYYHQSGISFDEDQTVLETVNDTRLLSQFLFPHDMLENKVGRLSGGEKRRLYLLTILMQQPNLLILDEPTNDLDIVTLNILEEYLLSFSGTLIIVSHDRHFLDRLAEHLFVFCGDGVVKDFIGGYTEYRCYLKDYEAERKKEAAAAKAKSAASASNSNPSAAASAASNPGVPPKKKKLSWKEQREIESLEADMARLQEEKATLEQQLSGGLDDYEKIRECSERYEAVKNELDEKEMRWLELND